jgi:hypothetical protein
MLRKSSSGRWITVACALVVAFVFTASLKAKIDERSELSVHVESEGRVLCHIGESAY